MRINADPQTSGGLLVSVPAQSENAVLSALQSAGYTAAQTVGVLTPSGKLEVTKQWA